MSNVEQDNGAEFTSLTFAQIEAFRGEFGGEAKQHLRDAVSSLLGRQSVDMKYPDTRLEDPSTYLQFIGEAAVNEARLLDELLQNGTVYNGVNVGVGGLDRYRLARIEYLDQGEPDKEGEI